MMLLMDHGGPRWISTYGTNSFPWLSYNLSTSKIKYEIIASFQVFKTREKAYVHVKVQLKFLILYQYTTYGKYQQILLQ